MPPREQPLIHRRGGHATGVRIEHEARGVDRLERACRDPLELADELIVPAWIDTALEEPARTVVREDQPVALHRHEHDLRLRAEARERKVRP